MCAASSVSPSCRWIVVKIDGPKGPLTLLVAVYAKRRI